MAENTPEKKFLHELRVTELRTELEKRGLDKNGIKIILTERLEKALRDEGKNVTEYQFVVNASATSSTASAPATPAAKKTTPTKKTSTPSGVTDSEETPTDSAPPPAAEPLNESLVSDASPVEETAEENVEERVDTGDDTKEELEDTQLTANEEDEALPEDRPASPDEAPALPSKTEKSDEDEKKYSVWVKGLPTETKAAELKALFSTIGKVLRAKIFKNKSNTYGEVMLPTPELVTQAIEKFNNSKFKESTITVEKKKLKTAVAGSGQKVKPDGKKTEEKTLKEEVEKEKREAKNVHSLRRSYDTKIVHSQRSRSIDRDRDRDRPRRPLNEPIRRPIEYNTIHRRVIATRHPAPPPRSEPYYKPYGRPLHLRTMPTRPPVHITPRRDDRYERDNRMQDHIKMEELRIREEKLRLQLEKEKLEKERLQLELDRQQQLLMRPAQYLVPQTEVPRSVHRSSGSSYHPRPAERERGRPERRERDDDRRESHVKHRSRSSHRHHHTSSTTLRTSHGGGRDSHRDSRDAREKLPSREIPRGRADSSSFTHGARGESSASTAYVRGNTLPISYSNNYNTPTNYSTGTSRSQPNQWTTPAHASTNYGAVSSRTAEYSNWQGNNSNVSTVAAATWPRGNESGGWNASTTNYGASRQPPTRYYHDAKY